MLRTTMLACVTAAVMSVSAPAAWADAAEGKATGEVSWMEDGSSHGIAFNAFDYGGEGDRGTVTYTNASAGFTYTATITRVDVTGSTTCFQYAIPAGSDAPDAIEGVIVTFQVQDAGTPSSMSDRIGYDSARSSADAATDFNSCAFAAHDTTSGNLVVH